MSITGDILDALTRSGGLTCEGIAAAVGRDVLAVRPRMSELKRAGRVTPRSEPRAGARGPWLIWSIKKED